MKNKDIKRKEQRNTLKMKFQNALKDNKSEEALMEAFLDYAEDTQALVIEQAKAVMSNVDTQVLSSRGTRQLTSKESNYYNSFISAARSINPQQSITNIKEGMPETIIDSVLEDLKAAHPLLEEVDMVNTSGAIKMLMNSDGGDLATWDMLNTPITKEIASSIKVLDMTFRKLSAYIPIEKDMLDLGPAWIDTYIRTLLGEAIAIGLEYGIVKGDGNKEPIGMIKNLEGAVTNGVYSNKAKVKLSSFDPEEYCKVISPLAKKGKDASDKDSYRAIPEVLLIVNPVDYIQKVLPSTTVRNSEGGYNNNIFPYPTKVIQSVALEQGEAVLGLGKKYFMGIGMSKEGKLEYSDEYQFLEDNRVYLTKFHGNGTPKDNNAFIYLNISDLKAVPLKVEVTNAADIGGTGA